MLRLLHHFFLGAAFFATGFFATGFFAAGFFAAAMWFSPPTGMGYISVNLGINKYFGRNAIFTHRIGVNNHFCSVIMARSDNKHRICLIICKMRNLFQQPCSCHCLHGCNRSGPVQQQPGDPEHACCEALLSSGQRARSGVGGRGLGGAGEIRKELRSFSSNQFHIIFDIILFKNPFFGPLLW